MRVLIGTTYECNKPAEGQPLVVFVNQLKSLSMDPSRKLLICHMDGGVNTMMYIPEITQELFMEIVRLVVKGDGSYYIKGGKIYPYL